MTGRIRSVRIDRIVLRGTEAHRSDVRGLQTLIRSHLVSAPRRREARQKGTSRSPNVPAAIAAEVASVVIKRTTSR